jgi:hypothetical protein
VKQQVTRRCDLRLIPDPPLLVFMERTLKFDIFAGAIDKDARWLEAVKGLANAKRRMHEIAAKLLGRYFLFCDFSHGVVALTDASSEMASPRDGNASAI